MLLMFRTSQESSFINFMTDRGQEAGYEGGLSSMCTVPSTGITHPGYKPQRDNPPWDAQQERYTPGMHNRRGTHPEVSTGL